MFAGYKFLHQWPNIHLDHQKKNKISGTSLAIMHVCWVTVFTAMAKYQLRQTSKGQ